MTISFGGLASGVDTSSWIEALVSMKQASLKTYEQKKEVLEQTTSILDNVKSFFNSFKSVLTNVTNSNLGITSFDLFIQKLVDTTNAEVVTANVTTEAQEASYEVNVEQVATATEAQSSFLTTITTTTESIATHNSLLSSIGIGTGQVGIVVGGVERMMTLQSNDTISSLIEKLNKLGVDASYDAQYGYFSVNLGLEDINDTYDNTGIKDAFFLTNVNSGYASDLLELLSTFTNVITATENSKMSAFGITDGEYIITDANDTNIFSTHTIDVDKTFREFFDELQAYGFDAGFNDDGSITMVANGGYLLSGALAEALELVTLDNSKQTTTKASSTVSAFSTETINIDFTSTLGDIGAITSDNDKLVILDRNYNTIKEITTLDKDSTIDDLFGELAKYGISGAIEGNFITLNSKTGNIISGSIAENMGIDTYVDSTTTIKAGNSTTSTSLVSYVASSTDWISDCLWDVWDSYSDEDKVITVSHTDRYGTDQVYTYTVIEKNSIAPNGAVLKGTQFQDIMDWFNNELDATSTLKFNENGQIYIDSNDCFYFEGKIADYLGLSTYNTTYTWTEGITTTQSTETVSFRVRKTDYIADTLWDNGWLNYTDDQKVISAYHTSVDHIKDGVEDPTFQHTVVTLVGTFTINESQTVVGEDGLTTTIVQGTTFEDLANWYTTQIDTTATFIINNDGTITIDSDDTFKLEGQAITDLGLGVSTYHQSWTTGTEETRSSAAITYASKMTDYISDTFTANAWSKVNKTISVYTTSVDHIDGEDGNSSYQVTVQSKLTDIVIDEQTTFNNLASQLALYDIDLTIDENGVLKLNSTKANFIVEEGFYSEKVNNVTYAAGTTSMLDHFGVQFDTVTQTWTTGLTTTESTTDVSYVSRLSDYISDSFRLSEWAGNSSHGAVNKDIIIYHSYLDHNSHVTVIEETTRTTISDQTTFEDLKNFLAQNSITMTMTDGVIGLDSANYFIAGERYTGGSRTDNINHYGEQVDEYTGLWTNGIMNHFGGYTSSFYTTFDSDRTSYSTINQTWTTGTAATESNGIVKYNIKMSDYISDTFTADEWASVNKNIIVKQTYVDHNTQQTVISEATRITINENMTFQDLANILANLDPSDSRNNIILGIDNGVLTLDSNCRWLEGDIVNHYGTRVNTQSQSWTTGIAATQSTGVVNYKIKLSDYVSDTLTPNDWTFFDRTIYIDHSYLDHDTHQVHNETIGAISINSNTTFEDLQSMLASYGIDMDIVDGVLTLDSDNCNYIWGDIPDYFGLTYDTITQYWTTGTEGTRSHGSIYYSSDNDDRIKDLFTASQWSNVNKTLYIKDMTYNFNLHKTLTNTVGTISVTDSMTISDLASQLSSYGISLNVSNGSVTMDSDRQGCWVEGDIANTMRLSYNTMTITHTYGVNVTSSSSVTYDFKSNDTIYELVGATGWDNLDKTIYLYQNVCSFNTYERLTTENVLLDTYTVNKNTTYNDILSWFESYQGNDMTISVGSTNAASDINCYLEGDIANVLGFTTMTHTRTYTAGIEVTSSEALTFTGVSMNDKVSDVVGYENLRDKNLYYVWKYMDMPSGEYKYVTKTISTTNRTWEQVNNDIKAGVVDYLPNYNSLVTDGSSIEFAGLATSYFNPYETLYLTGEFADFMGWGTISATETVYVPNTVTGAQLRATAVADSRLIDYMNGYSGGVVYVKKHNALTGVGEPILRIDTNENPNYTIHGVIVDIRNASNGNITGSINNGKITFSTSNGYYLDYATGGSTPFDSCCGINVTTINNTVTTGLTASGLCYTTTTTTTSTEGSTSSTGESVLSPILKKYRKGTEETSVRVQWTATHLETGKQTSKDFTISDGIGWDTYYDSDLGDTYGGLEIFLDNEDWQGGNFDWNFELTGENGWRIDSISVTSDGIDLSSMNDPTAYHTITSTGTTVTTTVTTTYTAFWETIAKDAGFNNAYYDIKIGHYEDENGQAVKKTETIRVYSTDSFADWDYSLEQHHAQLTVFNGEFYLGTEDGYFIESHTLPGMSNDSSIIKTYNASGGSRTSSQLTKTADENTKMIELGGSSSGYSNMLHIRNTPVLWDEVPGVNVYDINWDANDTIGTFLNKLQSYGLNASISSGRITIGPSPTTVQDGYPWQRFYVQKGNSALSYLGLSGDQDYWMKRKSVTAVHQNCSRQPINQYLTNENKDRVTLAQMGLIGDNEDFCYAYYNSTFVLDSSEAPIGTDLISDGVNYGYVELYGSKTVGDVLSEIRDLTYSKFCIDAELDDNTHKITILDCSDEGYFYDWGLYNPFKLGTGYTSKIIDVTSIWGGRNMMSACTLNLQTTASDLNISNGYITYTLLKDEQYAHDFTTPNGNSINNTTETVTFYWDANESFSDFKNKIESSSIASQYGIRIGKAGSSKAILWGSNRAYVSDIDYTLANALNFDSSFYQTSNYNMVVEADSDTSSLQTYLNSNSRLSDFGINSSQSIDIVYHTNDTYVDDNDKASGTTNTITVTWSTGETFQQFLSKLPSDISAYLGNDAYFNFSGNENVYVSNISSGLANILNLSTKENGTYGTSYGYTINYRANADNDAEYCYLNERNTKLHNMSINSSQTMDIVLHTNNTFAEANTDATSVSGIDNVTRTITVTWTQSQTLGDFEASVRNILHNETDQDGIHPYDMTFSVDPYTGKWSFTGNEYTYVNRIDSALESFLKLSGDRKENGTYGTSYNYTINYRADADRSADYCYLNERNTKLHNMSINSDQTMTFVVHTNNTFAEANTDATSVSGIDNVTSTITVTWTTSETLQQFEDKINAELAALHSSVGAPNNVEGNYSISFSVDPNTGKWSFSGNEFTYVEDISSELANFTQLSTKENGTYGTSYDYSIAYRANADDNQEYTFLNERNTRLANFSINSDQTIYYVVHTHNTFVQDFTGETLDEATLAVHNGNQVDTDDMFLYDNDQRGNDVNNEINYATTHTYTIGIAWTTGETLQQYEDKVHSTLASLYNSINALRTSEPLNIDTAYDVHFSVDAENGKLSFTGNEYTYIDHIGDDGGSSFNIITNTSSEAVTYNASQIANANTTFAQLGISTDEAVNVYDSNGNSMGSFNLTQNSTIGDFLGSINSLTRGGNAGIHNGVISIGSGYITGAVADELGLNAQLNGTRTITITSTNTSSEAITYNTSQEANANTTFAQLGIATNRPTQVFDSDGNSIGSFYLTQNSTIGDFLGSINALTTSGNAGIHNSVISIGSGYVTGNIANALGLNVNTESTTVTITGSSTYTSSESVTYNTSQGANESTTFAELGISTNEAVNVYDSNGNSLGSFNLTQNSTIGDFLGSINALTTSGNAGINNSVISIGSGYVTGAVAEALGLNVNAESTTVTEAGTSTYTSSEAVTYNTSQGAGESTTFAELGISTNEAVTVYDSNGNSIGSFNLTQNSTVGDFLGSINALTTSGNATINNGVISIGSGSVTGEIADELGIDFEATYTSSEVVTYDTFEEADESTTFAELGISTNDSIEVFDSYGNSLGSFNLTQNSTLEDFLDEINALTANGNATIDSGVITIESGYITGAVADELGIGYKITDSKFTQHISQVTNFTGSIYVDGTTTYTVVGTASDLQSALNANQNVILSDDIDLDGFDWAIVNGYSKNFDGNGHVISNLNISTDERYAGLLGSVESSAIIANVGLENITVSSDYSGDDACVGGLVGHALCSIANCYVSDANIESTGSSFMAAAGGLVGQANGSITDSNVYDATVSATGEYAEVGGLAGYAGGSITNSDVYYATVSAAGISAEVGGLAGWAYNSTIDNSNVYYAALSADEDSVKVGGLVGKANDITITESNVNADISASGNDVGKLIGYYEGDNNIILTSCTYDSSMTSPTNAIGTVYGNGNTGTTATSGAVYAPDEDFQSDSVNIYVSNNITYTVVGTAWDLQDALSNNQNVILSNDIDLDGFDWAIVNGYSKNFDGNGHVISNLNISTSEQYAGLFGSVASGATIANVGLENITVSSDRDSDDADETIIGGLAGYFGGTSITNCYVSDAVIEFTGSGWYAATGGLTGWTTYATITDSHVYNASVSSTTWNAYVGGLTGCFTNATITGSDVFDSTLSASRDGSYVGGLAGYAGGSITNSDVYDAALSVTGNDACVGGLVGEACDITITGSNVNANISASGDFVGKLIGNYEGDNNIILTSCTYDSSMTSPTNVIGTIAGSGNTGTTASSGTVATPYVSVRLHGADTYVSNNITYTVVGTASDLQNALNNNQDVILSDDIDLDGFNWSIVNGYNKNFNGNGHVISNLSLTSDAQYVGLFGSIDSATIANLGLENITVSSNSSGYNTNVGGLAGYAYRSSITNCYVSDANIEYTGTGSSAITGGLVGSSNVSTITNSNVYNTTVSATGNSTTLGGLAGNDQGTITNSNVYNVTVTATNAEYAGGLAGTAYGTITNSNVYDATINVTGIYAKAGGVYGYGGAIITGSNVNADISASGDCVGKFVGYYSDYHNNTILTSCTYDSSMTSPVNLIGYFGGNITSDQTGVAVSGTVTAPDSIINATAGHNSYESIPLDNACVSTTSNILTVAGRNSISASTTLGQLGLDSASFTTSNGTVNLSSDDSIFDALQDEGLTVNINNGKITIISDSDVRLTDMSENLVSALKLGDDLAGTTLSADDCSAYDSRVLTTTVQNSITNSTTLGQLGLNSASFTTNNGTVNLSSGDSVVSALQSAGLTVSINDGKVSITSDSDVYLTDMSSNLASALKLGDGVDYSDMFSTSINQVDLSGLTTYTSNGVTYQVVGTASDLQTALNNNQDVILSSDIDLEGFNWSIVNGYNKNFDGNGHVISNLSINSNATSVGFIGQASGGTIKNVGFTNANVTSTNNEEDSATGIILGSDSQNGCNIDNVFIYNSTVNAMSPINSYDNSVGGVAGALNGSLSNVNIVDLTINARICCVGGAVGVAKGELYDIDVYNLEINHTTNELGECDVGGIAGMLFNNGSYLYVNGSSINNNTPEDIYMQACEIGGVIGCLNTNGSLDNVYANNVDVNSNSIDKGGIIGVSYSSGSITNVGYYNTNTIDTTDFGGILGYMCISSDTIDNWKVSADFNNNQGCGTFISNWNFQEGEPDDYTSNFYCSSRSNGVSDIGNGSNLSCVTVGSIDIPSYTTPTISGGSVHFDEVEVNEEITTTYSSTNSNSLNGTSQAMFNASTTLGDLGLDSASFTTNNGTVNLSSGDSVVSALQSAGLTVSVNNGIVSVICDSENYITDMDSVLAEALNIDFSQGTTETIEQVINTYSSTDSNSLNGTSQTSFNASTTLGDLGLDSASFTTNNGTVNLSSGDSVVSALQNAGLEVSINRGKLTITGGDTYITDMDSALANALHIDFSQNSGDIGVQVFNNYSSSASDQLTSTGQSLLNTSTTLADLGFNSSKTFTLNDGTVVTIGKNDSIVSKLRNAGLIATVSNGKLTVRGGNTYITGMDSALANTLNIDFSQNTSLGEQIVNSGSGSSLLENELHLQKNSTGTYGKSYNYNINYRPDSDTVQEHTYLNLRNTTLDNLSIFSDQTISFVLHVNNTYAQDNTKATDVTHTVTVTWTYGALNTEIDMDNSNPLKPETFGEFIADIYRTLAAETTRYADQNLDVNFGFCIGTDQDGDVDLIGNKNSNVSVSDTLGFLMENGKLNEDKFLDFINKGGALDGDGFLRFRGNEYTYIGDISDELAEFFHLDNQTKENGTYGTSYDYDIDYANNSNNQAQYTYMNYDKAKLQNFDIRESQYITIVTNNNTTFSADSTKNGTVLIDNTSSTYVIEWTAGSTGLTKNANGSYNNNDNGVYDGETFAEFIYELEHFGVIHNLDTDASKVLGNDIYKIHVTINDDKTISLVGNEYTYISGISDDLQKILKVDSHHTEDQVLVAENGIHITESTKLSELGLSNENFTMNDGRVINISSNDSIVNKLRSAGLSVNISDDKIIIDGNSNCFIKKVSTDLSDALNFKIGEGYYYSTYDYDLYFTGGKKNDYYDSAYQAFNHDIEFTTHKDKDGFDNSNGEVYTDQVNLTILNYDTRLNNLSILSNMTMTLETPDGGKSIEIDPDETIQQLKERLFSDYGIDVTVDKKGGLLTFTPTRADEGYYIVGIDTEFKNKFFITTGENGAYTIDSEYSYETETPGVYATAHHTVTAEVGTYATSTMDNYSNTNSRSLDYTDNHLTTKLSTRLSKINGYEHGNGKIRVHYSDGFEQDVDLKSSMTIGQMCDVLADYGVKAEVLAGGRITFSSENGTYLKSVEGGSNLLDILNMSDFDITVEGNTVINSRTLSQTVETTTTYFASEDTLLSEYAEGLLEANGVITFLLNDKYKSVTITSDDTFGTLIDKFKEKGLQSKIVAGVFSVSSGFDSFSIVQEATTSNIGAILKFGERKDLGGYAMTDRSKTVISKTTSSETNSISVSNYADSNTTFDTFRITSGSLSVYKDGQKALVQISGADTAKTLQDKLRNAYGQNVNGSDENNICVKYIDGNLKIFQANTSVIVGSNEDSSNFSAITGIMSDAYYTNIAKDENNTKMEAFNIETGSLSVIKDGQKAQIQVSESDTAKTLQDKLRRAYGQDINGSDEDNICVKYIDGKMKIYQNDNDVIVGSYDDTSNISAVLGMMESSNVASSTRKFYKVNENAKVTEAGLFRNGDVTTGEFVVGDATITISEDTTIKDILTQINTNPEANATAYWDSIDGEFVIKSKTTGDFYINIEANNSNFTDIMGLTNSTYDSDHVATSSTINTASQVHGKNARVTINGATYTSTSNTIGSDVTGLEGLTINVKNISTDGPTVLTVKKDVQSLALAVSDVIDAYNELIDNINSALTSKSELQNDSDLKRLRNQIKSIMTSSVKNSSPFKNIVSVGIVTNAADPSNLTVGSGIYKLTLDVEKFAQAFEADSEGVRTFLIGKVNEDGELIEDGILTRIEALIDDALTGASGYFERTEDSIDKQLDRVEAKIVKGNAAIEKYREKLEKKYMSMNILNGNIQTQYQVYFK